MAEINFVSRIFNDGSVKFHRSLFDQALSFRTRGCRIEL